jgi:cation:H+ antiporter
MMAIIGFVGPVGKIELVKNCTNPIIMVVNILGFAICAALIFFHGQKLSRYGDRIATQTGLGRIWIGLILMAAVTSLPELGIGISAVAIVGSADLAVGDILGSCVFNLAILSLLDALSPGDPILARVSKSQVLAISLTTILLSMVGVGIFMNDDFIMIGWIGVTSLVFALLYALSIKLLHEFSAEDNHTISTNSENATQASLRSNIIWYSLHAVVVVAAAFILPYFAEGIAIDTGLSESFVGTFFLATSSSFPEMAIAISAARMGAADMAVGNLFGSNIFNIFTLFVNDLFYTKDYLLKDASDYHLLTVFGIIIMNCIVIAGLTIKPKKKQFHYLAWDTLLILIVYVLIMIAMVQNS